MTKARRVGGHVRKYSGQSGSHENRLERDLKRRRKEFRKRIIEARKAIGISQRELAVMIGCSQSLVSRVERGGEVDFVLFERWAAALTAPSFQTFATLDWRERASYPLATERHYRGHSIAEWKEFVKLRRWPQPPGYYDFAKNTYKRAGKLFARGESIRFYKSRLVDVRLSEIFIPSPS